MYVKKINDGELQQNIISQYVFLDDICDIHDNDKAKL